MLPKILYSAFAKRSGLVLCASLAFLLSACGGGGGSPGSVPSGSGATTQDPRATISLVNASGAAVTSVTGTQAVTVKMTVVNGKGAPAPAEIVTFAATGGLTDFTPASASALTDAAGVASITLTPKTVSGAGAISISGTAVVAGKTVTATTNLAVVAAPLTLGTPTFSPNPPPAKLAAGSALLLTIPITSGGQPAADATGLVVSSLCKNDGSATIALGTFTSGVQSVTYTNNGCLRGTDVISVQLGTSVQSLNIGVDPANLGSIQFVGSDLTGSSIVLKGSGGLGRQESALLTFRVLDQNNQPLSGVTVDFTASTYTGGLTLAPVRGISDANGRVATTVSSGTIPTPVRVFAQATRNGNTLSGLSDTLTISTGLPIQKGMSLSSSSYNIEGWQIDGAVADITVRLADQFGNPISDDTAVSFVSEGGAIGSAARGACVTKDGGCSVKLTSQNFRPADGRVTILAYVQGLENFVDLNGDGQYSCTSFISASVPASTVYRPLIDTCVSGGEPFTDQGDPFLDTGMDGIYNPASGDFPIPFNNNTYNAAGNGKWGLNFLSKSAEIVFSGSDAHLVRVDCTASGCTDSAAAPSAQAVVTTGCSPTTVDVRLFDLHNNPMPAKTTVTISDTQNVTASSVGPAVVPSTNDIGGTLHRFTITPASTCAPGFAGSFSLKVTTPGASGVGGIISTFSFIVK